MEISTCVCEHTESEQKTGGRLTGGSFSRTLFVPGLAAEHANVNSKARQTPVAGTAQTYTRGNTPTRYGIKTGGGREWHSTDSAARRWPNR